MDKSHWQIARAYKLPGVQASMMLYPQQIGTRIKRPIQRMLKDGVLMGGWRSKAKQLATMLDAEFDLGLSSCHSCGVSIGKHAPRELRDKLIELVEADMTAAILEEPRSLYYIGYSKRYKAALQADGPAFVGFHSPDFGQRAVALIKELRAAPGMVMRRQQAIEMLDGSEAIPITHFNKE